MLYRAGCSRESMRWVVASISQVCGFHTKARTASKKYGGLCFTLARIGRLQPLDSYSRGPST